MTDSVDDTFSALLMHVLLLRPVPINDRFGLGPFFRIEPLGLEYIAAALEQRGHRSTVVDLRYGQSVEYWIRRTRPAIVGVACMHALETEDALALAERVRRTSPHTFIVVGGHSAAAYPDPFCVPPIDAVCVSDGETVLPDLADALAAAQTPATVRGLLISGADGCVHRTDAPNPAFVLDNVPLPLRRDVDAYRHRYACLLFRPVWLIETARGCPFRCSFCSVWQMHHRTVRLRSVEDVCADFEATGPNVFIADDLFWYHGARSLELAHALRRRGVRKRWLLVQSRTDVVANQPDVIEAWRPLAQDFDIFFGLEAATDDGLTGLVKDTTIDRTVDAIRLARDLRYGVTGNFVIDPDWDESDFERLWGFIEAHDLGRAGFTILTPLPGTRFFAEMQPRLRAISWAQYDMHHLMWEPKVGAERFFELYCETWRRSILNLRGHKRWRDWVRQVRLRDVPLLTQMLLRTQRMMQPAAHLVEHRLAPYPAPNPAAPAPRATAALTGRFETSRR
jgi:hopanoid C-3 methylase